MRLPRQAAALALTVLALGCPRKQEETEPAESPAASSPRAPNSPPTGVRVPLPPGWSAQVAADESFQAGPPGKPVLRVDLRLGEGASLPSPEQLTDFLGKPFRDFAVSLDQEEGTKNLTLVRLTIAPRWPDGGVGPEAPALLGARRVGDDLFLCASLPGASAEEVRLATEACRDISLQR
jgi:hypothetical protein